jgi:hypothetical protein
VEEASFIQEYWWQLVVGLAAIVVVPLTAMGVYYTYKQYKQGEKREPQQVENSTPPPPLTPSPLPNTLLATHFVDRPDLIAKIMQAIAPQQSAGARTAIISSLQGMGGVGKTELAREVARQMAS